MLDMVDEGEPLEDLVDDGLLVPLNDGRDDHEPLLDLVADGDGAADLVALLLFVLVALAVLDLVALGLRVLVAVPLPLLVGLGLPLLLRVADEDIVLDGDRVAVLLPLADAV